MNPTYQTKHGNKAGTHEWYTPPEIIKALGKFDLDPCSPVNRPYDIAEVHYNKHDDGLSKIWKGRVFCNPPYGNHVSEWIRRCSEHQNAIAFIFVRTDTRMFHKYIFNKAHSIFFFDGRIQFYTEDGILSQACPNASCLISWNWANTESIRHSGLKGKLILL